MLSAVYQLKGGGTEEEREVHPHLALRANSILQGDFSWGEISI